MNKPLLTLLLLASLSGYSQQLLFNGVAVIDKEARMEKHTIAHLTADVTDTVGTQWQVYMNDVLYSYGSGDVFVEIQKKGCYKVYLNSYIGGWHNVWFSRVVVKYYTN